ncbi:MAG: amino acid ABC transporter permease [Rhodovibrionaceae bacterium]|nr:amino acid ABC transporter permease [Rhodovibrionaceae bacterium]
MQQTIFTTLSINDLWFMMEGAAKTLWLTFWGALLGTCLGAVLGWIKTLDNWLLTSPVNMVTDVLRSVPLLIQFVLWSSGLGILGFNLDVFHISVIALSLYMAAYVSEVVRGGILAVPTVTRKAARSLGMTYWQDLRYVVLPIGTGIVLPAWIGLVLGLMKDTSLVAVIGYIELLRASQIIINRTQEPILVLLGAGIFYFALGYPISKLSGRIKTQGAY